MTKTSKKTKSSKKSKPAACTESCGCQNHPEERAPFAGRISEPQEALRFSRSAGVILKQVADLLRRGKARVTFIEESPTGCTFAFEVYEPGYVGTVSIRDLLTDEKKPKAMEESPEPSRPWELATQDVLLRALENSLWDFENRTVTFPVSYIGEKVTVSSYNEFHAYLEELGENVWEAVVPYEEEEEEGPGYFGPAEYLYFDGDNVPNYLGDAWYAQIMEMWPHPADNEPKKD